LEYAIVKKERRFCTKNAVMETNIFYLIALEILMLWCVGILFVAYLLRLWVNFVSINTNLYIFSVFKMTAWLMSD